MDTDPHTSLGTAARNGFVLASVAVALMVALMLVHRDGADAIATIAGFPADTPAESALRLALFCDTLLPIGYASAFCLLALDRAQGRASLATAVCLFTALGASADFLENGAAVYGTAIPALTVAKYGTLGIAAFLLGVLVNSPAPLDRLVALVMQVAMPLFLATILSGLLGAFTVWLFAPSLLGSFVLGALVSRPMTAQTTEAVR